MILRPIQFFTRCLTASGAGACLALIISTSSLVAEQLDILVIGSTRSFSDTNESGVVQEKAFNPTNVASRLQSILSQDPLISDSVNVEFEDIYKTKELTVRYSGSSTYPFTSHCYSLAQHYMWPEGKAARLTNLRGEGDHQWDYIILCNDPYIMANFPGMYAEGVKLIKEEIAKSANPAQLVLLAQWPENSSSFSAEHFNEIVHRVGSSAGLAVVPAGKAWNTLSGQDTSASHPTPHGEYLAASALYSKILNRSAKSSAYTYSPGGDAIADHALATVQTVASSAQYTGKFDTINPFLMKYVPNRTVTYRETGTSTEDRIRSAIGRLNNVFKITTSTTAKANGKWDFNYGRGNDWWEDDKDYEVDPTKYDRSYGFPMHHYYVGDSINTMPYGIDKHYYYGSTYEDGTDLGIAYNMIRPGTREDNIPLDVRAVPIRLLWLKMAEQWPGFDPLGDNTHMHPNLNDATAAFMYVLLSGRCPVVEEPATPGSNEWMEWLGHKVGYETAWQMSHLTTRVPGFKVQPSATAAVSVTPSTTETMSVKFAYQPQSNVTVTVTCSNNAAAIVGPKTLVFTPLNYNTPQQVTVAGIPGASASDAFDVQFSTSSTDEIFDGLSDSWSYTNERASTQGVSQFDNGTSSVDTVMNTAVGVNLNATGSNSGNTVIIGPSNGSYTWTGDGVLEYTPNTSFIGSDLIVYAATVGSTQTIGCISITVEVPAGQVNAGTSDANATEEGTQTGTFTLSRLGDTNGNLSVYFTMSGTATLGSDYTLSHSSPVTIPNGQSSVSITLTPVDDSIFGERSETAILNITPNAANPIGTASSVISIADNDNNAPSANAGSNQALLWQAVTSVPGLGYGTLAGNINTIDPNPQTEILVDVSSKTEDNIAGDTTEVYSGYIYDADGNISFTEHIDDKSRIWIDGVLVLSDDNWRNRSSTANLALTPGWHTIEIRISNGGGGSGPVSGIGIGYDPNGGVAWQTLVDPGNGSLLKVNQGQSGATTTLSGTVFDPDGDPMSYTWNFVSGPGTVNFGNANALTTTANFTATGTYVVRLTADDGYTTSSSEVTILVSDTLPSVYSNWAGGTFTNTFSEQDLTKNPEGDPLNNLEEFAFGTDPTIIDGGAVSSDGSSHGMPITSEGGDGIMEIVFVRRDDHGASGSVNYSVQFSSDLDTFYNSAATPIFLTDSAVDSDYEVVKIDFPATLPNGKEPKFARITVTVVP